MVKVGTTYEPMIVYVFRKVKVQDLSANHSITAAPKLLLK